MEGHHHRHKSVISHHFKFDDAMPLHHYDALGRHQIIIFFKDVSDTTPWWTGTILVKISKIANTKTVR